MSGLLWLALWWAVAFALRVYVRFWESYHAGTAEVEPRRIRTCRHLYLILREPWEALRRIWAHVRGIVREVFHA